MSNVFLSSVAIPFVFLLLMSLVKKLVHSGSQEVFVAELGWDLSILAVGISGAIFSAESITGSYGEARILYGYFVLAMTMGLGVSVASIRYKTNPLTEKPASLCLALGLTAVAIPSGIVFGA